jgi:hypothetical protein
VTTLEGIRLTRREHDVGATLAYVIEFHRGIRLIAGVDRRDAKVREKIGSVGRPSEGHPRASPDRHENTRAWGQRRTNLDLAPVRIDARRELGHLYVHVVQ